MARRNGAFELVTGQWRVGFGTEAQEELDIAGRPRQRAGGDIDGVPVQFGGPARDRQHRVGAQCRDPTPPHPAPTRSFPTSNCGFTIGTISASGDAHAVSAGSTVASEMNDRSATTRSTGPPMASAVSVAHVRAFQDVHPLIGPQRPGQLPVADVGGDDLGGAPVQQDLGEAAGRRARVEAAPARRRAPRTRRGRRSACARRATPRCVRRRRPSAWRPPTPRWPVWRPAYRRCAPGRRRSVRRPVGVSGPARVAPARHQPVPVVSSGQRSRVASPRPSTDSRARTSRSCACSRRAATASMSASSNAARFDIRQVGQQRRDVGADLVGIGTHIADHASRCGQASSDQRCSAARAVSSPARHLHARPSPLPHRVRGGPHDAQRVAVLGAGGMHGDRRAVGVHTPGRVRRRSAASRRRRSATAGRRRGSPAAPRRRRAPCRRRCSPRSAPSGWAARRRWRPRCRCPAGRRSPADVRNSPRASASFISVGAGLPATWGSLSVAVAQRGDHRTVARQQSAFGRQRAVDVGGDPQRTGPDRQRRLGQIRPAGLR